MAIQSVLEAYGDNIVGSGVSLPNSFILRNKTLTFDNLVATVTDSRITTTTLLLTYYSDDSVASAAGVKASVTAAGAITFTATSAPASTLSVDIVCIVEGLTVQPEGGSGHEIENSAGTKLTQRDVMQVLDGLEAVDDSTNQKTKIKMNLPIVSSADWNAMTEQEKTAYKASHYRFGVEAPDTEGVINAEYMKLLWENHNTTQSFAAQTITLNSADYDFLLIVHRSVGYNADTIIEKGMNALAQFVAGTSQYSRVITRISDTQYSVGDGNSGSTVTNTVCVPIAIYGIKKNFQFKVNAIATDLSTRADHCFLNDYETSVEDYITTVSRETIRTGVVLERYGKYRRLNLHSIYPEDATGIITTLSEEDRPHQLSKSMAMGSSQSNTLYCVYINVRIDGKIVAYYFNPGTTTDTVAPSTMAIYGSVEWLVD